ncbi:MAG TPA: hypothetical protein VNS08_10590 [Ureibacillus sp.]|nr:hypothetical protein [Ureibacillus sp.]
MNKYLVILTTLFLLIACQNEEDTKTDENQVNPSSPSNEEKTISEENSTPPSENEEVSEEVDFKHYFKPSNTTATFKGDGNEFAGYTETTKWIADNYVATVIDTGGARIMKVYRVLEDKIVLVMDELIEEMQGEEVYPDITTLEKLPVLETYLARPIEVGTKFDRWTIVETNGTLATPYQTFENVFVLEETGEEFINRKYFAEDYGVIKSESITSVELSEEIVISSTLEDITTH